MFAFAKRDDPTMEGSDPVAPEVTEPLAPEVSEPATPAAQAVAALEALRKPARLQAAEHLKTSCQDHLEALRVRFWQACEGARLLPNGGQSRWGELNALEREVQEADRAAAAAKQALDEARIAFAPKVRTCAAEHWAAAAAQLEAAAAAIEEAESVLSVLGSYAVRNGVPEIGPRSEIASIVERIWSVSLRISRTLQ